MFAIDSTDFELEYPDAAGIAGPAAFAVLVSRPRRGRHAVVHHYHETGLPITLCRPGGKTPIGAKWHQRVWTSAEIDAQFENHPDLNVGLVLGPRSGIIDIEIDGAGGDAALQMLFQGDVPVAPIGVQPVVPTACLLGTTSSPRSAKVRSPLVPLSFGWVLVGVPTVVAATEHYGWLGTPVDGAARRVRSAPAAHVRVAAAGRFVRAARLGWFRARYCAGCYLLCQC